MTLNIYIEISINKIPFTILFTKKNHVPNGNLKHFPKGQNGKNKK